MYIREVTSPRKHGPDAVYVQLAQGHRDSKTGKVKTEILHSFGRKETVDVTQVRRLVHQLSHYLDPDERPELLSNLQVTHTWDYGGTYLLDAVWRELELDTFFSDALEGRSFEQPVERALFALVGPTSTGSCLQASVCSLGRETSVDSRIR